MYTNIEPELINTEGNFKSQKITLNAKEIVFPMKAVGSGRDNYIEGDLVKKEVNTKIFNELSFQFSPHNLVQAVTDDKIHQKHKNKIRKGLEIHSRNSINIAFPLLMPPNETEKYPMPKPEIFEKLFDLFDIEYFDILILPVDPTNTLDWIREGMKVFKTRKADFLNEYSIYGYIPRNISETTSLNAIKEYAKEDIPGIAFDMFGQKVMESRMKKMLLEIEKLKKQFLKHGLNVPHWDFHNWRRGILPTYDLLTTVYGFDSFGNIRFSYGGKKPSSDPEKIKVSINRKRFRNIETYGSYTLETMNRLSDTTDSKCSCSLCKKSTIQDLINSENTLSGLESLKDGLKTHRWVTTHKEMETVKKKIASGKYVNYVKSKKDSADEITRILS